MRPFLTFLGICGCALAQSNPLVTAFAGRYNSAKQNLIGSAEAMPETDYSFKLSPAQRTFAEWVQHTALGNYSFCAAIGGTSADVHKAHDAAPKADLQRDLAASFEFCDTAIKGVDDQKALTADKDGKYPVTAMFGLIAGLNDHYGNIVGYLRAKGITPPSSVRTKR
jgi:hypothetical protein